MAELKKIGVLSLGKIYGILMAIMGLFIGIIYALIGFFMSAVGAADPAMPAFYGLFFGVGALFLMPVFYGGIGFVSGIIGAFLYNIIAGWIGGLELEIK